MKILSSYFRVILSSPSDSSSNLRAPILVENNEISSFYSILCHITFNPFHSTLHLSQCIYDGIFFVSHQAKSGLAGESSAWRKLHRLSFFFFSQQHFYIRQFSFSLVSPCSKDSHSFFISLLAPRGGYTCEDEKAQDKARRKKGNKQQHFRFNMICCFSTFPHTFPNYHMSFRRWQGWAIIF